MQHCMQRRRATRAFTLIEVLVVLSVISILIVLLVPSLMRGRETGRLTVCMSNLRQVSIAFSMYMQDSEEQVPWVNPHPDAEWVSPYGYGGFVAPIPEPYFGANIDYVMQPAENRPLNKYLSPDARGSDVIPFYVCPSDNFRNSMTAHGGGGGGGSGTNWRRMLEAASNSGSSWESAGNSYAINWWWMNYYYQRGNWSVDQITPLSHNLVRRNMGGQGSTFVVFFEAQLHALLSDARTGGGGLQGLGWHGWSRHNLLFFDGHAEHRAMDSRYPFGDGWTVWPSPN